jgi:hypothetical protein
MPYCTACGATVDATDNFCEQCGHEVGTDGSPTAVDEPLTAEPSTSDEDDPFEDGATRFALGYPVTDEYEPFLLGSIVTLIGYVLPPLSLFTAGYAVRLTSGAAHGERTQPSFDDFRRLFVDGLWATVAVVVLWGVVAAVGASVAALAEEAGVGGTASALALWGVVLGGVYVTPAVLTTYAVTGRLGAAFSQRFAGAFAVRTDYLVAFAVWLAIAVVGWAFWLVAWFTLVGPAFVTTYTLYVSGALWGYYYREAAQEGVVPALDPEDDPVATSDLRTELAESR